MEKPKKVCPFCGELISCSNYSRHLKRHEEKPESFQEPKYRLNHDGLICQFCGKEHPNRNSLCNHERMCASNPNRQDCGFKIHMIRCEEQGTEWHPWSYGLTKETDERVAAQAKTITKERPDWQTEVDDDNKLYRRYLNKCVNAQKDGLRCDLTFHEYCLLVKDANLKSSDLGFTGNMYVLARYNDQGNYTWGNCRFITQKENYDEKVKTDAELYNWREEARKKLEEKKNAK